MSILFVRHCEILIHPNFNHNSPLSKEGMARAIEIGKELERYGFNHIFTSPMIRAVETACYLARALTVPVIPIEDLTEWGWHKDEEDTVEKVRIRCLRAANWLKKEYSKQGTVIVVSHGGPIQMMVAHLLHKPENEVSCERGQYIHVEF